MTMGVGRSRGSAAQAAPRRPHWSVLALLALCAPLPLPLGAQDANLHLPVPLIESHLRDHSFRILEWRGSRALQDRTQRVIIAFPDTSVFTVKWANAPPGGSAFNNEPRYEVAAYEIQKLFLEPQEYVVPPTVLRTFSLAFVREQMPGAVPTFSSSTGSVVVVLQYWLQQVGQDRVWDPRRAQSDSLYARHVGNLNVFTYLIRHGDSNIGNQLISQYDANPRVFSVDNGISFRSPPGLGTEWRVLRTRRIPRATVDRLRAITRADLEAHLAVLAEYEVRDGELVPVPPGPNLGRNRGVRQRDGRVQFGLTSAEIADVERRLRTLLTRVDRGQIELF